MNQIKFQDPNNNRDYFLMSATAMQFFNDIVKMMQKLALIGGQNYILQGCTVSNNNVAPGFIVYNGELFYCNGGIFFGGTTLANAKLHITETPSGQEVYNNQVQTGARVTRTLTLVSNGNTGILFNNLKQVKSLVNINNSVFVPEAIDAELRVTSATDELVIYPLKAKMLSIDDMRVIFLKCFINNIPAGSKSAAIYLSRTNDNDFTQNPVINSLVIGGKTFDLEDYNSQLITFLYDGNVSQFNTLVGTATIII